MTYLEISQKLGVQLCTFGYDGRHCTAWYFPETNTLFHEKGAVTRDDDEDGSPVMHWRERRMMRSGLRHFLYVIAEDRYSNEPTWRRIWLANLMVQQMAKTLGVKMPRHLTDKDRARLRFTLARLMPRDLEPHKDDYRRALRWAARS